MKPENQNVDLDLIKSFDEAFVRKAYRIVLHREVDADGLNHYLGMLRNGANKWDVLGRLRYSVEGRRLGVKIPGLLSRFIKQRLYAIPFLGRLLQILTIIWQLPNIERSYRALENYVYILKKENLGEHLQLSLLLESVASQPVFSVKTSSWQTSNNGPLHQIPQIKQETDNLLNQAPVSQRSEIDLSDLSPRAQRIYHDLVEAIQNNQRNK